MARLATLLVKKAKLKVQDKETVTIGGVQVRRNKYDSGFVFSYDRSTYVYIDDESDNIEDDKQIIDIAGRMLTVQDVLAEVHAIIESDINKAIQILL